MPIDRTVDALPLPEHDPHGNALRFMRRVRWLGAIFTIVQFGLYQPPPGLTVPFDKIATGLFLAHCVVAINLALWLVQVRLPLHRRGWLVAAGLLADASVVVGVVWLFRFDTTSALWGLLVIPVLEAAVAAQMSGALGMWAALSVTYLLREYDTAQRYDYAVFEIPSVTFRMGIVLIVAATAGSLARSLTHEARAQRTASLESQKRARLLHGLALSSQPLLNVQMQADVEEVWKTVVTAAIDVGFHGASVAVPEPDGKHFRIVHGINVGAHYVGGRDGIDSGLAGAVWASGETVVVEDYSAWSDAIPSLQAEGFGAAIGVPIRRALGVDAVLVAAYREPGPIQRPEQECLSLLALHAGVALNNVAHLAERTRYEAQLTEIAYSDTLTGLPNRDLFAERLEDALTGGSRGVAVLFVDVDRFKTVNDSLGHHGGDELLVTLAGRLVEAASPHLVARFGGDEFTVLVQGVNGPEGARAVAEALMRALSTPVFIGGQEILPSISVGIRCARAGELDGSVVLRDADTAMYRAKDLGRQRVEIYDALASASLPSLTLEAEMRRGLERDEFELHYQPVVTRNGGAINTVEALLRWNHPQRGLVSPADFIPVAEASGLISPLGRWVLGEACRQAVQWSAEGCPLDVAVNVSLVQLQDTGLLAEISSTLQRSGLAAQHLLLEITESATVNDPALMLAQALRIRDLGVRLALDDFGQGTTSLRFVRRLPLDVLKIDKSLVDDLVQVRNGDTAPSVAVVRSVIQMAHELGLSVTAEGVEDQQQLELLDELGCDAAQGYLLGRPMPAAQVPAAVAAGCVMDGLSA